MGTAPHWLIPRNSQGRVSLEVENASNSPTLQTQWQKSGAADLVQEKPRLKKWKMYAVLVRQKNYELSFSHPGSLCFL